MKKYEVSAYISGHDHNLQLIKKNGLIFATSGAGAYVDDSIENIDKVGRKNVKREEGFTFLFFITILTF